jgi:hypothetical protein
MNESEIEYAACQHQYHPVLGPASRTLFNFMDLINCVSDGWCYWRPPVHAAHKLMELVEGKTPATEESLKKALIPIKSFCTRRKLAFPE